MRKRISISAFLIFTLLLNAQQVAQYSQYMLNTAGLNPAATGFSSETEVLFGRRNQWIGFDNAPITSFISVHKGFGKRVYKNFWHGAGVYVEEDKAGLYTSKQIIGNYAFHLSLYKGLKLGFGMGLGIKLYSLSYSMLGSIDPAIYGTPYILPLFPDLSAGICIYSRKFSMDISGKQLYMNETKYKGKKVGSPGRLIPHIFITLSKKYETEDYFYAFVPSVHIKTPISGIPSLSAGGMLVINRRVGIGLYGRYPDAAYGVLQIRIVKNILIGIAYDYSLGGLRSANANSFEVMIGATPMLNYDGFQEKPNSVLCPMFSH